MTTQQFLEAIEKTYSDGINIIKSKNKDYSTAQNPFRNFEYASYVNVCVEDAIMVRISDKIARIANLMHQEGRAVMDERIEDTILDCINYLAILKTYLESKASVPGFSDPDEIPF